MCLALVSCVLFLSLYAVTALNQERVLPAVNAMKANPVRTYSVTGRPPERTPHHTLNYRHWGLEERDWKRYLSFINGPRGLWTPQLDPLLVLGIHATDAHERERFATAFVAMEEQRIDAEMQFQRAVNRVLERRSSSATGASIKGAQLVLFAAFSCGRDCAKLLVKAQSLVTHNDAELSIYISGAADDDAVRSWALVRDINSHSIAKGRIRLNHDRGEWERARHDNAHLMHALLPQLLKANGRGGYILL